MKPVPNVMDKLTPVNSGLYGLLAEFDEPSALLRAACDARNAGYRHFGAYTPIPVEGLTDALNTPPTKLPWVTLLGGLLGAALGYGMQYYASVWSYPLNVGGRPLHSWPAFLPITFELGILGAALSAVLGMLALNGLPTPYHPLFNVAEFSRASRDRFFLCIQARDSQFEIDRTRAFLAERSPNPVIEVPL